MVMSHPLRVRGLKRVNHETDKGIRVVAPFTGAWIETIHVAVLPDLNVSHPLRVRGLKLQQPEIRGIAGSSHPLRVRGLKPPDSVLRKLTL